MKNKSLLILTLCASLSCVGYAQTYLPNYQRNTPQYEVLPVLIATNDTIANAKVNIKDIQDKADSFTNASYPGGMNGLLQDISKNLVYPASALEQELQGTVVLRFKVKTNGETGSFKVEKSLSPECDKAAINVVKKLKRFTPAKKNGKPVSIWYRIPIRFRFL